MKKHYVTILAALIIVYLIGNLSAVITYPDEYKVIKTMGKISRVTTEPGFSMRIPLIQSETTISKARQLYDIAPTEIYTSDKKKMEVDAYIVWVVTDPIKFTQTLNASEASAESKISAMVYGALKTTVSATTQEELIASRDAALDKQEDDDLHDVEVQDMKSEDLEDEGGDQTQTGTETDDMSVIDENTRVISLSNKIIEQLDKDYDPEQYGIEIQMVKIKKLDLPEENKDSVYNRMITERKNIAAAYKAQGESEAQKIRNTTDRETAVMISEAEARADQLEAEGEAEYMRILSDAYNDPDKADYYLFVRQLDAAKKSLESGNTTLFLDSDSPLASVFESTEE
ncbi:MAG: protease modulator HflC [Lachnospiraceae bacterium]|nr:protease modulator HflC [Lachnospiraceae bacterium]